MAMNEAIWKEKLYTLVYRLLDKPISPQKKTYDGGYDPIKSSEKTSWFCGQNQLGSLLKPCWAGSSYPPLCNIESLEIILIFPHDVIFVYICDVCDVLLCAVCVAQGRAAWTHAKRSWALWSWRASGPKLSSCSTPGDPTLSAAHHGDTWSGSRICYQPCRSESGGLWESTGLWYLAHWYSIGEYV